MMPNVDLWVHEHEEIDFAGNLCFDGGRHGQVPIVTRGASRWAETSLAVGVV